MPSSSTNSVPPSAAQSIATSSSPSTSNPVRFGAKLTVSPARNHAQGWPRSGAAMRRARPCCPAVRCNASQSPRPGAEQQPHHETHGQMQPGADQRRPMPAAKGCLDGIQTHGDTFSGTAGPTGTCRRTHNVHALYEALFRRRKRDAGVSPRLLVA